MVFNLIYLQTTTSIQPRTTHFDDGRHQNVHGHTNSYLSPTHFEIWIDDTQLCIRVLPSFQAWMWSSLLFRCLWTSMSERKSGSDALRFISAAEPTSHGSRGRSTRPLEGRRAQDLETGSAAGRFLRKNIFDANILVITIRFYMWSMRNYSLSTMCSKGLIPRIPNISFDSLHVMFNLKWKQRKRMRKVKNDANQK